MKRVLLFLLALGGAIPAAAVTPRVSADQSFFMTPPDAPDLGLALDTENFDASLAMDSGRRKKRTYVAQGSSFLSSVLLNAAALSGVSDGPVGTMSLWVRGGLTNGVAGVRPNMLNSNILTTWDYSEANSELVKGVNLVFDNAASHNGNIRFNLANSAGTIHNNSEASYVSPVSPLVNTAWNHVLISWDMTGTTSYAAIYVNGVNVTPGIPQNGAFNVGTSFAGSNGTPCGGSTCSFGFGGTPVGSQGLFADMADVWIDFSHSILTAGTNTIPLANRSQFINSATLKPVRINKSGNCSDPFGYQPTMCFTNDGSTFQTNMGYSGSFNLTAPEFAIAALAPSNVAVVAGTYPTPITPHTVVQSWQNGGGGALTTTADSNQIAVGDLLVAIVGVSWSTNAPSLAFAAPDGTWTQLYNVNCPCTANSSPTTLGVFYKIAQAADATAYNGTTATGYTGTGSYNFTGTITGQRGSSWRLIDYVGVNQTTPLDVSSTGQTNTANSTTMPFPSFTTSAANELAVGIVFDWGSNYGPYSVSGNLRGSDYLFAQSSYRPEIIHFDKQMGGAGSSTVGIATVTRATSQTSQAVTFGIIPQ